MVSWLAEVVQAEGGQVRFDRFMELALYDQKHGYYTGGITAVGRAGDFSTAATIGSALFASIANWIKKETSELGFKSIKVIELGGGSGQLAAGILRQFAFWQPVTYQIVEISAKLRTLQRQALRGRKIRWQNTIEEALDQISGEAVIISNEFVDAFPCRRFEKVESGWADLALKFEEGTWREVLTLPSELPSSSSFNIASSAGQRVEVHLSYHQWLKTLASKLRRGALLTIDYGGRPAEIYARKPAGTIRGYYRHQRMEGGAVYLRPGQQDLTADVNFEDLENWGNNLGLELISYSTQAEFIERWNPGHANDAATEYMLNTEGMGSAFKVLHQRVS